MKPSTKVGICASLVGLGLVGTTLGQSPALVVFGVALCILGGAGLCLLLFADMGRW